MYLSSVCRNGLRFGAQFGIEDIDSDDRFPSGWCEIRPHAQPHLWGAVELRGRPHDAGAWLARCVACRSLFPCVIEAHQCGGFVALPDEIEGPRDVFPRGFAAVRR